MPKQIREAPGSWLAVWTAIAKAAEDLRRARAQSAPDQDTYQEVS